MTTIDAAALDAAERFVFTNARLLDRLRFAHQFRGGAAEPVLAALRPYANADGGFGHALEPDLRGPDSQPQPVAEALAVLHETADGFALDAASAEPLVPAACDWLASVTADDGGVPWVLPSVASAPRAPWWQPMEPLAGSLVPTAAIAGLLYAHGVAHPWLDGATRFCLERIDAVAAESVELGAYDALALLPFLDHLPDRAAAEDAFARVREPILATATLDPDATGHVHLPLEYAPSPDGFGRRLFADEVIDRHLDVLVAARADDGGWSVNWPAWAPVTEHEWRGSVTVTQLRTLRAYGRWTV